jgi:hypothetical protein
MEFVIQAKDADELPFQVKRVLQVISRLNENESIDAALRKIQGLAGSGYIPILRDRVNYRNRRMGSRWACPDFSDS